MNTGKIVILLLRGLYSIGLPQWIGTRFMTLCTRVMGSTPDVVRQRAPGLVRLGIKRTHLNKNEIAPLLLFFYIYI